ncbi:hypothetical protein EDF77_2689 [Stenotrophomonas maltophilia]|uniref:hypothetical protein n=1 Tax=Stenotrophomonas chelatiphaga TaxID=517011 RepID=UPI000F4D2638|nr:hypothetical protein [Stenotrophomonas chelatiphaga]MCS4230425.1 hypothetical protein [Stenotrophomonas chelatiphaga]ROQ40352.1 hypothetical protein EDF77_2689 [Stenotrophomonas maltophilia]
MQSLQDVYKDAIEVDVRSGDWKGVGVSGGEGSLINIDIDEDEIEADYSDIANGRVLVTAKGVGTIYSKDADGEDQEQEEDVIITAEVEISVEGRGNEGVYPTRITVTRVSVRVDN